MSLCQIFQWTIPNVRSLNSENASPLVESPTHLILSPEHPHPSNGQGQELLRYRAGSPVPILLLHTTAFHGTYAHKLPHHSVFRTFSLTGQFCSFYKLTIILKRTKVFGFNRYIKEYADHKNWFPCVPFVGTKWQPE